MLKEFPLGHSLAFPIFIWWSRISFHSLGVRLIYEVQLRIAEPCRQPAKRHLGVVGRSMVVMSKLRETIKAIYLYLTYVTAQK